jgi:hypothetical protein
VEYFPRRDRGRKSCVGVNLLDCRNLVVGSPPSVVVAEGNLFGSLGRVVGGSDKIRCVLWDDQYLPFEVLTTRDPKRSDGGQIALVDNHLWASINYHTHEPHSRLSSCPCRTIQTSDLVVAFSQRLFVGVSVAFQYCSTGSICTERKAIAKLQYKGRHWRRAGKRERWLYSRLLFLSFWNFLLNKMSQYHTRLHLLCLGIWVLRKLCVRALIL